MRTPSEVPFKTKKKVSVFLTQEKEKELKKKAIDLGISLSELVSLSASEYAPNQLVGGTTEIKSQT